MLFKIGLTYKRMDLRVNELRDEMKENTARLLRSLKSNLEKVSAGIGNMHEEVE